MFFKIYDYFCSLFLSSNCSHSLSIILQFSCNSNYTFFRFPNYVAIIYSGFRDNFPALIKVLAEVQVDIANQINLLFNL